MQVSTTEKLWKLVGGRHTGWGLQHWRNNTVERCLMQPTEGNPGFCFPTPNLATDGSPGRIILALDPSESYLSHKQRLTQVQWRWSGQEKHLPFPLVQRLQSPNERYWGREGRWQEGPATTNSLAQEASLSYRPETVFTSQIHWGPWAPIGGF